MTKYRLDTTLPSHGRKTKADNAGNVSVSIFLRPNFICTGGIVLNINLNINPAAMTYNATLENLDNGTGEFLVTPLEIPSDVLERMVRLAHNKDFMSVKNSEILPDKVMLDGNLVTISVKSDIGNLSLESNLLEETLLKGYIPTTKMTFHTPFALIASVAFKACGIDPYEDLYVMVD